VDVVKAKYGQATQAELSNVTEENVLLQMQHLKTHPAVVSRLSTGEVDLHGWVYDIEHGTVVAFDEAQNLFIPVEELYADLIQAGNEKQLQTTS